MAIKAVGKRCTFSEYRFVTFPGYIMTLVIRYSYGQVIFVACVCVYVFFNASRKTKGMEILWESYLIVLKHYSQKPTNMIYSMETYQTFIMFSLRKHYHLQKHHSGLQIGTFWDVKNQNLKPLETPILQVVLDRLFWGEKMVADLWGK